MGILTTRNLSNMVFDFHEMKITNLEDLKNPRSWGTTPKERVKTFEELISKHDLDSRKIDSLKLLINYQQTFSGTRFKFFCCFDSKLV